jgi:DNA-nicking Smr family endonuclease
LPPVRNRVDISKQLEEAKKKKAPAPKKPQAKPDPNDIFTEKDVGGTNEGKPGEVKYKRDVTPMPDYYKAWDTYDIDKALASDEEEESKKPSKI